MSINVNVRSNPINVKRGKMFVSDFEYLKEKERQKRRKLRLEQVRQQSKDIAEEIRNRVRNETNKQLSKLEKLQGDELKRWKAKKILTLQRQYNECLHEIGSGHKQAALQPKPEEILRSHKKNHSKIAQERGVKAIEVLHKQQQKQKNTKNMLKERRNFVQNIEKVRSAFVSNLEKKDRVNTIQEKTNCHCFETTAKFNEPESLKSYVNQENVNPNCKFNFKKTGTKQNVQKVKSPLNVKYNSMTGKKHSCKDQKVSKKKSDLLEKNTNIKISENEHISQKVMEESHESKCIQTECEYPISNDLKYNVNETSEKVVNNSETNGDTEATFTNYVYSQSKPIQNEVSNFEQLNKKTFNFTPDTRISELISKRDKSNIYDHSNMSKKKNQEKVISQNYTDRSKNISTQVSSKTVVPSLTSGKKIHPKVEFYDHDNRFSHQYTARSDIVQRDNLNGNLLRSGDRVEEIISKEYDMTRGKIALHKEKIDRDYKNLLEDLAVIQKEERLSSSRNISVQNAHLSDERLKHKEQKRQKQMESIFEEAIHEHYCTPIITVESVEKNTVFPTKNKIIQNSQLNVATWDLPQLVQKNNNKKQTLENLLQRINMQKKLLLEEVKMLPEQRNLERKLDQVDCTKSIPIEHSSTDSLNVISSLPTNKSDLFDIKSTSNKKTEEKNKISKCEEAIYIIPKDNGIQQCTSKVDSLKDSDTYENTGKHADNKELSFEKRNIESNKMKNEIITSALVHHSASSSDFVISNEEKLVNIDDFHISKNNTAHKILPHNENSKSEPIACTSESNLEHSNSKKQHIEIHIVLKEKDTSQNIIIDPKAFDNNLIRIKKNLIKHSELDQKLDKKEEVVNIETSKPVQSFLNIQRPNDIDPSFSFAEHSKLENSEVCMENSESTSYMSLPQVKTFKSFNNNKNVDMNDLIQEHNEVHEIHQNKIKRHESIKKHINKLLKMSKNNIDNLCVSSVSSVSTPDSNIIQTSKNINDVVDSIVKQTGNNSLNNTLINTDHSSDIILSDTYSSLFTQTGLSEGSNIFKQSPVESNLQMHSNNLYTYNSSENNQPQKSEESETHNLYKNHHQNMLLKYSELTENCTKRINDLTSLINELRRNSKTFYSHNDVYFVDNGNIEKKIALSSELPVSKNDNDLDIYKNKQNLQQKHTDLENSLLNKGVNEFNSNILKQLYKHTEDNSNRNYSTQPIVLNEKSTQDIQHIDSTNENEILFQNFSGNFNLLASLPKFHFKMKKYQENDIVTQLQSDISDNSVFSSNSMTKNMLQKLPNSLENNNGFSILDISAINNTNAMKYRSKPPLSLAQNAVRHNIDIRTIPSHDLSTIIEVDTPVILKADLSKNLSQVTELSRSNISKKQTVTNNFVQKDSKSKNIDIHEKQQQMDSSECINELFDDKYLFSKPEKTIKSINKEVNVLPQTSIELSSIDSPLSDDFEIALRNMGIDWGISTIRKTQAALQLSSSSSSLDISLKKLGVKLLDESNRNSVNLKDILQKQLLKKSNSGSASSDEIQVTTDDKFNIKKYDEVYQDSSTTNSSKIKQKQEKNQGRTSTPVSLIKTFQTSSLKSNEIPALFSDNDISSVNTPNVDNLSLIVPNYSLEISSALNKCNSS